MADQRVWGQVTLDLFSNSHTYTQTEKYSLGDNMLIDVATHALLTEGIDARSIVIDLWGNDGAFARAMAERFGCTVVATEPSAPHVERLAKIPSVRAVRAAVCERTGWADFHVNHNSQMSSIVPRTGTQ